MKKQVLELLICPHCLPLEYSLVAHISKEDQDDIETGSLHCPHCAARFPITEGVADLDPCSGDHDQPTSKYEAMAVVSSYLWSHYGELMHDAQASRAYAAWAQLITPQAGIALDAGGAVGRFTFEMSCCCDFAIGIDTSHAFIQAARRLMRERTLAVRLKDEGLLHQEVTINLPDAWQSDKVEFVVANALALPFRKQSIAVFSSLNLVDKVPSPLLHLQEMNRVTSHTGAQFLLSDPFSWSTEVADAAQWLGGKLTGPFAGKGLANAAALLVDPQGLLTPAWQVGAPGSVWWKIRTHSNHYELIRSCCIHACR